MCSSALDSWFIDQPLARATDNKNKIKTLIFSLTTSLSTNCGKMTEDENPVGGFFILSNQIAYQILLITEISMIDSGSRWICVSSFLHI